MELCGILRTAKWVLQTLGGRGWCVKAFPRSSRYCIKIPLLICRYTLWFYLFPKLLHFSCLNTVFFITSEYLWQFLYANFKFLPAFVLPFWYILWYNYRQLKRTGVLFQPAQPLRAVLLVVLRGALPRKSYDVFMKGRFSCELALCSLLILILRT